MENRIIKTELITSYIKNNNLSKTDFCKACKISTSTLNKILDNNENINLLPLFKITKTMGIKFYEIFR